jgi:hypothetical protein
VEATVYRGLPPFVCLLGGGGLAWFRCKQIFAQLPRGLCTLTSRTDAKVGAQRSTSGVAASYVADTLSYTSLFRKLIQPSNYSDCIAV